MFDMLKNLGGAGNLLGGLGDFEKIGEGIVAFQASVDSRMNAILNNQLAIMQKLGIAERFDNGAEFSEVENAG